MIRLTGELELSAAQPNSHQLIKDTINNENIGANVRNDVIFFNCEFDNSDSLAEKLCLFIAENLRKDHEEIIFTVSALENCEISDNFSGEIDGYYDIIIRENKVYRRGYVVTPSEEVLEILEG